MESESDVKFCILKAVDHFEKCLSGDDDVGMDEYLEAYSELSKFFSLMGKASDTEMHREIPCLIVDPFRSLVSLAAM